MGTGSQPSLWEEVPNLHLPTLAVAGEEDGKFVPIAQEVEWGSVNVCAVVVPDAGHIVHTEVPGKYIGLLRGC